MSSVERTTSWQQIQQGVKDAERLIARKEYNLVMIKARQTLECMVRCMAERACLVEGDLSDTIDQLYEGRWIDKATKDSYHAIRILGNKAVHEGDDTLYDANQAYQLLTQAVYTFANEFGSARPQRSSGTARSGGQRQTARQAGPPPRASSGSRNGQQTGRQPSRNSYSGSQRSGGQRKRKRRRVPPLYYILRLMIPVLIVILLIVVIRLVMPGKSEKPDTTTTSEVVTTAPTETAPTPAPEPETTTAPEPETAGIYRVKGNGINVRTAPSTDQNSRVLTQLSDGTEVDFVKRYSNDWTVINYDGQEAYISSQFLEKVEETTDEADETQESSEEEAQ